MGFVREPAVSGAFYPDDPQVLRSDVERYLANVPEGPSHGEVVGIVAPHAGYMYSGQVAAYGYRTVRNCTFDTVVVIAPSHRVHFNGAAIMDEGSYRTPLGEVAVDEELAAALVKRNDVVVKNPKAQRGEHSLEVQLPFLQVVLKDFRLIPLIMGAQTIPTCRGLAAGISETAEAMGRKILVVGSTDLSHYHSYSNALELDRVVVAHLNGYDVPAMIEDMERGRFEACGAGPMVTTMMVARSLGAQSGKVMKYANSGDVTGDRSTVVGYVSAVFCR